MYIPKYRIGIWRVFAQAARDEKCSQYWTDKIILAYNDPKEEDRLHAIETLAKLEIYVVHILPKNEKESFRLYSLWNYSLGSKRMQQKVKNVLVEDLVNNKLSELEMQVTSYILRYTGPVSKKEYNQMEAWIREKDLKIELRSNLLTTLLVSCPGNLHVGTKQAIKQELMSLRNYAEAIPDIMIGLVQKGKGSDREVILNIYEDMRDTENKDYNSDLHAIAAYLVLKSL